ncbi:MAG: LacI family DNA-binding transcriptional regulator [bacterium]
MNKVSIKDIAQKAGVCIGTVSRVINNLDRVHPATRRKILELIEETGYRPSAAGRSLVSGRTNSVLVVVHNIADPYCAAISKVFSNRWHNLNYKMLLGDSNYSPELEREHLARARDGSIDGLIVSPIPGHRNAAIYRKIAESGFPFVAIDNRVENVKTNCVKYDDADAASLAVEHLAGKGHRHIAFIHSRPEFQTVKDRLAGYRKTIQQLRLPLLDEFQAPIPLVPAEASVSIRALMRRKPTPTALLVENEIMAMVCMNTLLQAGYKIPQDAAVIAIGDTLTEHFAPVPLTTVSLKHDLMCEKTVNLLKHFIDSPRSVKLTPVTEIIRPGLVIRASA